MPPRLTLPANASYGEDIGDGRLFAPAAERNAEAIGAVLAACAPQQGVALEIASGTGQHVARFAGLCPGLCWQPTDADLRRLCSIDGWVRDSGLSNIRPAQHLDASAAGWSQRRKPVDLVLIVNLLHLMSEREAQTVLVEAARALRPSGVLVLYGPFLRDGRATSEGDQTFDSALRAADPEVGYKDAGVIAEWLRAAGLACPAPQEMPANNLCFVATRPVTGAQG